MRNAAVFAAAVLFVTVHADAQQRPPAAACGNGYCDEWAGESAATCPSDCERRKTSPAPQQAPAAAQDSGPLCGNGYCDSWNGESCATCSVDCCERAASSTAAADTAQAWPRWPSGVVVAAEFEAAFLVLGSLYGLGTRLGYRIEAGPVVVTPEGSFEWLIPDRGTNFGRAAGGLRFSLRGTVEPALFAHVGVIFDENNSDSAFDAGFSVDVHVLPIAALGVHAAVNRWSDSGFLFETLGIHASFTPFASLSERHTHASR